jgi:hypothetical protein
MNKKINFDALWSAIKKQKQKKFVSLKKRYQKLNKELAKLQAEKKTLEKAGVEFGTPNWKSQITKRDGSRREYLRILYVGDKVKYIGCKEDKVQETMAAIKRGVRVKELDSKIRDIEYKIEDTIEDIKSI